MPTTSIEAREPIVTEIVKLHRLRRFAMKNQQRADRSLESLIRHNATEWNPDLDQKARDKINAEVKALIKQVREGKADTFREAVEMSDAGRKPADDLRDKTEKKMRELATSLPVWPWVEKIDGFGELGLATIVAEIGHDLSSFGNVQKVWKRLGYAPYGDEPGKELAGSTWKREKWRHRALTADEWKAAPFSGERYAMVFTVGEWLVNKQWIGKAKSETGEGKPNGPYGAIYHARRQRTKVMHPDWTDAHYRKDALRITMKELLKNLWLEWTRLDGVQFEAIKAKKHPSPSSKRWVSRKAAAAELATASSSMTPSRRMRSLRPAKPTVKSTRAGRTNSATQPTK